MHFYLHLSNIDIIFVGFTPIVFTYVGSFIYVVILFRRFLAYTLKTNYLF